MKNALASLLMALLLPCLLMAQTKSLVFTHVTVIDMTGAPAKTNMTVVISGERITVVGKAQKVPLPRDARVVDASGKFLIPGLWDMHVHTLSKGAPDRFFPLFIANGITGVRDMGGDLTLQQVSQIKREITSGVRLGPRVMAAGPILEGARSFWPLSIRVKDAGEAQRAVADLAKNGADFFKVYNTLSRDAYFAIAAEARQRRIPFVGHIPEDVTPLEASRAGQKSIEHLAGVKIEITRDPEALRKQRAEARDEADPVKARDLFFNLNQDILGHYDAGRARSLFREFALNSTWHAPTLVVLRSYASIHDPSLRDDTRMRYMPRAIRDAWAKMGGKPDPRNDAMQKRLFEQNLELVAAMDRAGVKLLAGTDTPNPYTYPGFSLHNELELLVKAGFTPMKALQTATLNPAQFLNLQDMLGTVERGKIADLVLLDANPLENIGHTQRIAAVVVSGRYLPKDELQKMLTDVKAAADKE